MTKRTRHKEEISEDLINRLPDDILVNIISHLTLKEAARTSVLSNRWKNLWTFTNSLEFDASESLWNVGFGNLEQERSKYINWVNNVLELHRGCDINEFKVRFDLCDFHQSDITNWVYAALGKRVQYIKLDLWPGRYGQYYTFPQEFYNSIESGHGLSGIKFLRCLHFKTVNVSGQNLELFIQNCPLLDRLCVDHSKTLIRLRVIGSSIQLKYLEIQSCYLMEEIEISAPSLLSFRYYGQAIKIHIENVPQLVDVSIRGSHAFRVMYFIGPIISCFPQLKTLELDSCNEVYMQFSLFQLPKLIDLRLRVTTPNRESLLGLTCIMKACPFLQKLILQLNDHGRRLGKKRQQFPKYSHQHLKAVELHGFLGRQFDVELAQYLFQNATMLEKLTIEPSRYMRKKVLRTCVKMLEAKVPHSVKLVVGSLYTD